MATPVSRPVPVRPGPLPRVVAILYLLVLGCSLAIPTVLAWLLYGFLHRAEDAVPPFIAWLFVLHPVMEWLWWVRLLLVVAANVCFMIWLYLRYRELAQRGTATRYRPHWAITGFFVPFLNFVRPYQVVADACRAVAALRQKTGGAPATPVVVKLWWALWLVAVALGTVGGQATLPGRMELDWTLGAFYLCGAAVSALSIAVIARLEKERSGAAPARLLGPWPLPLAASASAVLALALVLGGVYGLARLEMRKLSQVEFAGFGALPPELIPRGAWPPRPPSSWQVELEVARGSTLVRWIGGGDPNLVGYNVYRREGEGAPVKLNPEPLKETRYYDETIVPEHTYSYSVALVDRWGDESPRSLEASATALGEVAGGETFPEPINIPSEAGVPGGIEGGVPGGVPGGQMGGVLGGTLSSTPTTAPKVATQRVRVSQGVMDSRLTHRVNPVYPAIAKRARITGIVVLQAVVSKAGTIENVRVVSGHPILVQAALDAARQWRYRPYLLNGEPVEVETTITINFTLSGG